MTTSIISVEPSQFNDDETDWTEALIVIERGNAEQVELMTMSPPEMKALYDRLRQYYEQGTWSECTVNW